MPPPSYDLTCPHCKKPFQAKLLGAGAAGSGFKCTNCKLFVPAERVDALRPAAAT